jgi:gliding motility-associated-like protein
MVSLTQAPNAGTGQSISVCSNQPAFAMIGQLGGTPQSGGTWSGPSPVVNGQFDPATMAGGNYVYTVTGTAPCANATATLAITRSIAPNAGTNGALTVCSNAPAFSLFAELGGAPEAGGQWTLSGSLVGDLFTPGTSTPGVYVYTVPGVSPCANATANVAVTQVQAPNAGQNRSITVCSNDAAFAMLPQLAGSPQSGGTWAGPSPVVNGQFNPATMLAGNYVYTVNGTAPCANASATLSIIIRTAPNAGTNGSIAVCSNSASFDLFSQLGGTPNAGGTWTAPGGASQGSIFQPGTDVAGVYVYQVNGIAPCANATASVTVTVQTAPNAGISTTRTVCSNGASFNMRTALGTTASGTWSGPSPVVNNLYDPSTMLPGLYTFTVTGVAPCANATATVEVTEILAPDAGTNGTRTVCSSGAEFDLFSRLGGSPDPGGAWTGPSNQPFPSGVYVPGTSTPGVYTYTVVGTAPCANDVSTVTVTEVAPPNAGTNGSVTLCSTSSPVALFAFLGGGAQTGGIWFRPTGTTFSGTYDPANVGHPQGVYTYVKAGNAPCPSDSATVTVIENPAPNAGTDGARVLCNTSAPANLFNSLGGSPGGNGTWYTPSNAPLGGSTFNPATGVPGVYKYIIIGQAPCVNDTGRVTVTVHQQPSAGTNGSTSVCSNGTGVNLFGLLGGSPATGGAWSPGNGTYTPGVSAEGTFTYTVSASAPCVAVSSTVTVNEERLPVAGSNGSVTVCSTDPSLNLFSRLGGTPDAGGTWSPGAANGVYSPATSDPGVFTYLVDGIAPCPDATATVTVLENAAPYAGENGTVTVCIGTNTVNLFPVLQNSPNTGGTWAALDNITPGSLSGSNFISTGVPPGEYDFSYTLPPNGQCAGDVSQVQVRIEAVLEAGSNGNCTVCNSNTAYNLFGCLGSNPQPGGTWKRFPGGQVVSQFYNASADAPGTYQFRYVLAGAVGCASDSATANVTVVARPLAGSDASVPICSNADPVTLFNSITGGQTGGTWRRQSPPSSFSGSYDPDVENSGVFFYIVQGTAPCTADTAIVTVTETAAPNAGLPAARTVCETSPPFNMTAQLGGAPATNGSWTDPLGQPHAATFVPGLDQEGTWSYTVSGSGSCGPVSNQLTIDVRDQAFAGLDGDTVVCSNNDPFLLFQVLNGSPDPGGVWRNGDNVVITNGIFTPGTTPPGDFTYVLAGDAFCPSDTARVSVFQNQQANAGITSVTTICPTGGPVQLITRLGGTPALNGTWANNFNGTYVPGTNTPGTYTYTVQGVAPCPSASASVTVQVAQVPNAGNNTGISECTSSSSFSMVQRLTGNPTLGGDWFQGTTPIDGIFSPNTTPPGVHVYTYVVEGESPCANDTSRLTITLYPQVDAGENGTASFCSNSADAPLFPFLTGTPQSGGTWRKPNGQVHSGIFQPGIDPAGAYRYKRTATSPCLSDSAVVIVTVNQLPVAGISGLRVACGNENAFSLINSLGGNPSPNGSWSGPPGSPGVYIPSNNAPGVFFYTVQGFAPCPNSVSSVTVQENPPAVAGTDAFVSVCTSDDDRPLFAALGGSPNTGGNWSGPTGQPFDGVFDPGVDPAGLHTYVVTGLAPCANDTARVQVFTSQALDAGISTALLICNTSDPLVLVDLLGGDPDLTGSWSFPLGTVHGPFFDPQVDPSGTYFHIIAGDAPCQPDTSSVTITLVSAPNAGDDGVLSACVSDCSVDLVTGLQGSPQANGTWIGPQQNGIFNACAVQPGIYSFTYVVIGNGSCDPDSAVVSVTVANALDAGNSGTASVCQGSVVDLLSLLSGTPQPGGVWVDLENTGAIDANGQFHASVAGVGSWDVRYVLNGSANCPGDSSLLVVNVIPGPDAGNDNTIPLCSNANVIDLIILLGGSPDTIGQWYGPDLAPIDTQFDPASEPGGIYTYVVPEVSGCVADTARVNILLSIAPDAGGPGSLNVCANGDPVNLFSQLTGTPDAGGVWRFNNVQHSNVYTPTIDNGGTYIYLVDGTGACADAQASVFVTEQPAPNAGDPNSISVCSSDAPFNLLASLAGSPQSGGTWRGPDGQPHGPVFNPAVDAGGVHTYLVQGAAVCDPDSAQLTIALTIAPDAGSDSTLNICNTAGVVDLFPGLGADTDTGGAWTDVSGAGAAFTNGSLDVSQLPLGNFLFTYSVQGSGPCLGATATITVAVSDGQDPGISASDTICGGNSVHNLFNSLGGTPSAGGVWTDPQGTGALVDTTLGILNATVLNLGGSFQFGYTVNDPGCGVASSLVTIHVTAYPDPGSDTAVTVCRTASAFDLFTVLGGDPDAGGNWTTSGGDPVPSNFDPGSQPGGTYLYNLPGEEPCGDTTAAVIIIINEPANAGADTALVRCNSGEVDLSTLTSGGAQAGGTWTDVDNSGGLSGSILDLEALQTAQYTYTYTVPVTGCSADTAHFSITVVEGVQVLDTVLTCITQDRKYTVSITIGGGDPASYAVTGLSGELTTSAPYVFTSEPVLTSVPFTITVDDGNGCSPRTIEGSSPCDFEGEVFVPESITPNGDGINDQLVIPGVEGYPNNSITIFNRWGAEVYAAAGYNNGDVIWDGTSENALIPGDLPTGTYYYVLELAPGLTAYKGFIYLNR